MADQKISALTSYTPPITTDVLPIVDITTSTTKKITIANLVSYLASNLGNIVATTFNKLTLTQPASGATLTISDGKTLTATDTTTLANASITLANGKVLTLTQGLTVNTNTGTLAFGAASKTLTVNKSLTLDGTDSTTMTFPGSTDTVVGLAATQTLTNKRMTRRSGTTTSSATPTINTDNVDFYSLTAQTADITSFTTNLSGTPTVGQTLWIAITGTAARAITWGASFEASTISLPTTTVTTNRLDVGFVWNDATSKWRCVATA